MGRQAGGEITYDGRIESAGGVDVWCFVELSGWGI